MAIEIKIISHTFANGHFSNSIFFIPFLSLSLYLSDHVFDEKTLDTQR